MMQILSAQYVNAEQTAAVAQTSGRGAVALSQRDTPAEWAAMLAAVTPSLYVAPPAPVPAVISDRQFFQQLAIVGIITQAEALAAVMTGTIPAILLAFIADLPADQQFGAKMVLCGATQFLRVHPLTASIGASQGMDPVQIDDFFRAANVL
jgi:hypothetical protein